MRLVDYVLLALAAASGLAATIGGIMLTAPRPPVRVVKVAFCAAAICFALLGVLWGMQASNYPMIVRLGAAAVTAALAAVVLTYVLSLLSDHFSSPEKNFAWIDVVPTANGTGALWIRNKTGGPFPNARISIGSPTTDIKFARFYPFIPEHGEPFWDDKMQQINLPPGEYLAYIEAENGTFFERLAFRFQPSVFQKIVVVQEGNNVIFKLGDAPPFKFDDGQ